MPTRRSTAALPLCCQAWVAESLHALRHVPPQGQGVRAIGQDDVDSESGKEVSGPRATHDTSRTPGPGGEPDSRTEGAS